MAATEALTQTPGYPVEKRMSARYEGTFARVTLKDRMPRILTQVIDTVHKQEEIMNKQHKEEGTKDVQGVLAQLSKLRYELETDKPMTGILSGPDSKQWAAVFETYCKDLQGDPTWFKVSWLFAECYMYRKIAEIVQNSTYMKDFDPFGAQKEQSFAASLSHITTLGTYLSGLLASRKASLAEMRVEFEHLLLLCLWGNKIDLSMIATMDDYDTSQDHLEEPELHSMRTNILADHSSALWDLLQLLSRPQTSKKRIDFVLDNSGFEIFSDLCFAEWLVHTGLTDSILFHCKQVPWFVSDALIKDFHFTLDALASSSDQNLSELGKKWKARLKDGTFVVTDHPFWTTSYEYAAMKTVAPDLHTTLSESYLVFFKGDLNYRKLLSDRNWLYTENFSMALGGFEPTNICALRTLKADLVTGLPPGMAEKAASQSKDWMITGQYAVLQVHQS